MHGVLGGGGGDLLLLGYRLLCQSPRAFLSILEMVVVTSRGVGTCKFLLSYSSQHTLHRCHFFAKNVAVQVGEELPRQ